MPRVVPRARLFEARLARYLDETMKLKLSCHFFFFWGGGGGGAVKGILDQNAYVAMCRAGRKILVCFCIERNYKIRNERFLSLLP